ncbi:MAG TPA: PilZ domain-containing protein [Allosphingosinicella sp.]|nr:PilZ domain-containing protein [Allosphingosinicella sp.]
MDPWSPEWFLRSAESVGPAISGTIGLAEFPPPPVRDLEPQDRVSERVPVELGAGLRQRGAHGVAVEILDLSTHGFRASTHLVLSEGSDVWLRLPGLEAIQARVAWVKGYIIGCAFERPLHPAVLEMIVSKSRDS